NSDYPTQPADSGSIRSAFRMVLAQLLARDPRRFVRCLLSASEANTQRRRWLFLLLWGGHESRRLPAVSRFLLRIRPIVFVCLRSSNAAVGFSVSHRAPDIA